MTNRILRLSTTALAGTVLLAFCALPALASPSEGGDGGYNIFAGDLGNVVWTLLIFGLVLVVLYRFAWGPLLDTLQQREGFIRESLESAKADRDAAEERLKEYEARLNEARAEATEIVEEGRRDAEVLRHRIEKEARAETEKMIDRAHREIGIARETAVKELYELSGRLATEIAGKIVGRELDPGQHERLIRDSIAEMEQVEN